MKKIFILFFIICSIVTFAENYKKIKIPYSDKSDFEKLAKCGIDLSDAFFNKDKTISVFLSDNEINRLNLEGVKYEVIITDWYKYYESLPKLTNSEKLDFVRTSKANYGVEGFGFGSMGGYYTMTEIYNKLDSMKLAFPNLITSKYSIGQSIENRPIYAVKISDNPDIDEDEPEVLYNSLIHCREPAAMMAVMYYMYYLLENYGTNPEVTYLVNNREIFFIPLYNVDGYEYNRTTNPNGGGMWRKNRRNNGGSVGVDLNRNFGYKWGYDNSGSSGSPSDETYRGSAAFSEPENQAFKQFVNSRTIKTALNYHTYSNYLLYSWSYENIPTPDASLFEEYAIDITRFNGYEWGQPPQLLYTVNGCTDDWMYGEQQEKPKIISFTPECGSSNDDFWPPQNRIFPIAQENLRPNLYITWVAGEYVTVKNTVFNQQYFNPGDQDIELNITFTNKGLSNANNITAKLVTLTNGIAIDNNEVVLGNIDARQTVNMPQPFKFDINGNFTPGEKVKFLVQTLTNGTIMSGDTLTIVIGTPQYAFLDDNNDPTVLWDISASPTTPKWEATSSIFYSSPISYTDSKTGSYANNATVTLTTKNNINLTSLNAPILSFWTKFDIESEWDCGKIQISTNNGTSWTNLAGDYTKAGSGKGTQVPSGSPIYDGVITNWVNELINLAPYSSNQIKLRFELKSDGSINKDGWYLDDIGIYSYAIIPVELTSFTANISDGNVILNWNTATELNNLGFEVQKSTNEREWVKIGFINGAGTSTDPTTYNFVDKDVFYGNNYYRLIQIDFDGTKKIINPIKVNFTGVLKYELLQNYPNPFNPNTTIKFTVPNKNLVTLKVYDVLGKIVATLVNEVKEAGNYSVDFNAEDLSSGTYFYEIKSGEFYSVKKMNLIK
ncbi:MAG TPA: M14 family zinc carboxypeptidase [Melioribacteraceae bacterium]|nr:M14 family zinc carboxypeptidase [Melioribacteraceae bacterium]